MGIGCVYIACMLMFNRAAGRNCGRKGMSLLEEKEAAGAAEVAIYIREDQWQQPTRPNPSREVKLVQSGPLPHIGNRVYSSNGKAQRPKHLHLRDTRF